jgi:hypothetical protein
VLGLHPDPDGSATTLDAWLKPYAHASQLTGFDQMISVNLYAALLANLQSLGHWAHGSLNAYFTDPMYIASMAHTVAVALPPAQDRKPEHRVPAGFLLARRPRMEQGPRRVGGPPGPQGLAQVTDQCPHEAWWQPPSR